MSTLLGIPYSPWSEKARWALDHHHVPFRFVEYAPLVGEPALRLKLKKPTGKVTVPAFFDDTGAYDDSFSIARHADEVGTGDKLFSDDTLPAIRRWNERSEAILAALRLSVLDRKASSQKAREEALPSFIPASARPLLVGLTSVGLAFVKAKHKHAIDPKAAGGILTYELEALRSELAGRPYLLGDAFSYADITMSVSLQFVKPVKDAFLHIGPGTREADTNPEVAARFQDLLDWRDALYEKHRRD